MFMALPLGRYASKSKTEETLWLGRRCLLMEGSSLAQWLSSLQPGIIWRVLKNHES